MVLARLCDERVRIRLPPLDLVLAAVESYQLPQKVSQAHGSTESREIRQENVPHLWRTLSQARWRTRATTHRQEFQSGHHGRDHVGSVGSLQAESGRRWRFCLRAA